MNYYKLSYTTDYCGVEDSFIYKSEDKSLSEISEEFDEFATEDAMDYLGSEELEEIEENKSQIAHISVEEISEEEYYHLKDEMLWQEWEKK